MLFEEGASNWRCFILKTKEHDHLKSPTFAPVTKNRRLWFSPTEPRESERLMGTASSASVIFFFFLLKKKNNDEDSEPGDPGSSPDSAVRP